MQALTQCQHGSVRRRITKSLEFATRMIFLGELRSGLPDIDFRINCGESSECGVLWDVFNLENSKRSKCPYSLFLSSRKEYVPGNKLEYLNVSPVNIDAMERNERNVLVNLIG
jgi:hypothetical protein